MNKKQIVKDAFCLLGAAKYESEAAERMLYAIAYQESNFEHRNQIGGPAKGFWQFERGGGVLGVLNHPSSNLDAERVCKHFKVEPTSHKVYAVLDKPENDVLAACFARLLLWTDPRLLPTTEASGWDYYIRNWRPGKPHFNRWSQSWDKANILLND